MPDKPAQQRPPITLEDLLRLKKAERPTPEFWQGFEQDLRQKTWQALVQPTVRRRSVWYWLSRAALVATPSAAVAAVAFSLWVQSPYADHREEARPTIAAQVGEPAVPAPAWSAPAEATLVTEAAPRFVVDALAEPSDSSGRYRRIMNSVSFTAAPSGPNRYVVDAMAAPGGSAAVTTVRIY